MKRFLCVISFISYGMIAQNNPSTIFLIKEKHYGFNL